MSGSLSDFNLTSNPATTSIINSFSSGGASLASVGAAPSTNAAKEVLSGALTANTLATILSVTGVGEMPYLSIYSKDTTSRTLRIVVTVDGKTPVAFDATSAAVTTTSAGMLVIGQTTASGFVVGSPSPLRFNSSLLVQIASSLSETDKVAIGYVLNKR